MESIKICYSGSIHGFSGGVWQKEGGGERNTLGGEKKEDYCKPVFNWLING